MQTLVPEEGRGVVLGARQQRHWYHLTRKYENLEEGVSPCRVPKTKATSEVVVAAVEDEVRHGMTM